MSRNTRDLPPAPKGLRFRRIIFALLVLAILAMAAVFVKPLLQPRRPTVADSEDHLARVKANLGTAMRVFDSADKLTQQMGPTNSLPGRMVHSIGQSVVQKLQLENAKATVEADLSRKVAAADYCVQKYVDFGQAQEGMVALNLSGIDGVVIRPAENSGLEGHQSLHELMVPHDAATAAVAALQNTRIRELKRFGDWSGASGAMQKLKTQGIRATVRLLKPPGQGDASKFVHILYVQLADEETAKVALDGSPVGSGR